MADDRTQKEKHDIAFGETATFVGESAAQEHAPALMLGVAAGAKLGAYTLLRELGRGAMGAVFEGVHATLGRRAAVKVLLPSGASGEEVRARFLREGQAASRIRHPNVVDVYDVGVEGGVPFLVMELLEGEDMAELLARDHVLSVNHAADIMVPVLCALAEAHTLGIVHRDLKPSNIFLARGVDGELTPKVVDFGISKMADETHAGGLTATSSLLGTPYYMSPEQAESSKHIDARTDQYAAAVILYEALSGKRPFEAESMLQLLTNIYTGTHQPLGEACPELPSVVIAAVERAMLRNSEDRFASALDLARELLLFAGERVRVVHARQIEGKPVTTTKSAPPRLQDPPSLNAAARTLPTAPEVENGSPAGKLLLYGTVAFVTVCVGFFAWFGYAASTGRFSRASAKANATATSAVSPGGSAALPAQSSSGGETGPRGPMLGACSSGTCDAGVAWCDTQQNKVACCAKGLVARSRDGVCGCPPGGTTRPELIEQGCKAPGDSTPAGEKAHIVLRGSRDEFRNCYRSGLDAATFDGVVSFWVELTPDGDVFTARVESSTVMHEGVQRCMLEQVRKLRFDPPPNGGLTMKYPLTMTADRP